ncbi:MAG: hypothetical protein AAGJ46_17755 [Planctomycetota bacterium]
MPIAITDRDHELLMTLTLRVRVITLRQATRVWWSDSRLGQKTARDRLLKLEQAGLVCRRRVVVHPLLKLTEPAIAWRPGMASPDFGRTAYHLRNRWRAPPTATTVFFASSLAANRFGGFGGRLKHRTQVTHDVHLSEVYFLLLREDDSVATKWRGEEILETEAGEKLPDAALCDPEGNAIQYVEFGGCYAQERVAAFHQFCAKKTGGGYQLW